MTGARLLRLAVPALVLLAIWHLFDGPAALARIGQAEPFWLLAALIALNMQTLLSALRWRLTAACLGVPIDRRTAIAEYYLTQFVNQTLPGGVLGDAFRAVRARHAAGLKRSGQAVVIERLLGQVALLTVMLAGFAVTPAFSREPLWPVWTAPLATAALGLAWITLRRGMPEATRASAWIAPLRNSLTPPGVWRRQALLGLAIVGCNLAAFALAARATGTVLSPLAVLTLIPLILIAMLLPASVAGWGWREGAAAALFPVVGAAPEAGLAASVTFGLLALVAALPGALRLSTPPHRSPPSDA